MLLGNTGKENQKELRVIKTARNVDAINDAVQEGYRPIVKEVQPSYQIRSKYAVFQHKKTGHIKVVSDFRTYRWEEDAYDKVIDWTFQYPYHFELPFAAYLVPDDIKLGERVFLEDLIEDLVGATWNQGDVYRLDSCEAVWNGEDFDIQYEPDRDRSDWIG